MSIIFFRILRNIQKKEVSTKCILMRIFAVTFAPACTIAMAKTVLSSR